MTSRRARDRGDDDRGEATPPTIAPLIQVLDAGGRFHRDSRLGRIYHRGTLSYRQLCPTDSLHVVIVGERISMHIDRISPLKSRPDGSVRYPLTRVVAHNLAGIGDGLTRRGNRMGHRGHSRDDIAFDPGVDEMTRSSSVMGRRARTGEGSETEGRRRSLAATACGDCRDRRLFAKGDLGPDGSFIFRSPEGGLTVGAHNLQLFALLAAGVDDDTWLDHLQRGDYARWFDEVIGDDTLTTVATDLGGCIGEGVEDSRRQIIKTIARRYPLRA